MQRKIYYKKTGMYIDWKPLSEMPDIKTLLILELEKEQKIYGKNIKINE